MSDRSRLTEASGQVSGRLSEEAASEQGEQDDEAVAPGDLLLFEHLAASIGDRELVDPVTGLQNTGRDFKGEPPAW